MRRSKTGYRSPYGAFTTSIPTGDDHLVDARRAQPGIPAEGFPNEVGVGINQCGSDNAVAVEGIGLQSALHGVVMHSELSGDRTDLPVFGMEQMPDLGNGFRRNHPLPRCEEWIGPATRPATDHADRAKMAVNRRWSELPAAASRRRIRWLGETDRFGRGGGRLIRHARLPETMPILPLPVPVIESSLGTRLVSKPGNLNRSLEDF